MSETGVIKFQCEHLATELPPFAEMEALNESRRELMKMGLVGVDRHGIGFGNLSVRAGLTNDFYITGSGTGAIAALGVEHYAKVVACDFARNWIRCAGAVVASSESLTHAAIYQAESEAGAVIHCHSAARWLRLLRSGPSTSETVEYGTPAMAEEVCRLLQTTDLKARRIFAMGGHEDGIVAFGKNLNEALQVLRSVRA